uniref:hypothetical protein n=1 Tax=Bacillus pumilus TaxID=1408 RepID=UPI001C92D4FE
MGKVSGGFELEEKVWKKVVGIEKGFERFEKEVKGFRKGIKIKVDIDEKKLKRFSLSVGKICVICMRVDEGIFRDVKGLNN